MYVEALGQQLSVSSLEEARRLTAIDRKLWHVISIRAPTELRSAFPLAIRVHHACFDDVEDTGSETHRPARAADLAALFAFAESLAGRPLLIHCQQGLSRSPAVALAWIYRHLQHARHGADRAVETLLMLRPQAKPNLPVLRLGLAQFLPDVLATEQAAVFVRHPRLWANRFAPA